MEIDFLLNTSGALPLAIVDAVIQEVRTDGISRWRERSGCVTINLDELRESRTWVRDLKTWQESRPLENGQDEEGVVSSLA